MKILQLLPAHEFHGGELATLRLSKELLRMGTEVVVVTSPALKDEFLRLRPKAVYVLPQHGGNLLQRARTYSKMMVYLRRILSIEQPDVVHVQAKLARILMLGTIGGGVVVETLHGVGLTRGEAFPRVVNRITDPLAAASFNEFISVSKLQNGRSSLFGKPIRYIPNSIDGGEYRFVPFDKKEKIVIFVGRLSEVKRPLFFVESIGLIHSFLSQRGVKVKMVGDGPLRETLELAINRLGLGDLISLEGQVPPEKVQELMASSFVYVTCSVTEGMSLALLEAMASGCAVVASDIPGNSSVIQHERTGLLFNGKDAAGLASSIERVIQEPSLTTDLTRNARKEFESNYDTRRNTLSVMQVYKEVVSSR